MREKIVAFIHSLILYDYILFGSIFVLFIFLIILSILFRRRLGFAIFLVLFAFVVLFAGPIVGYAQMHKYLYKNTLTPESQKRLNFIDAVMVKGTLKNESKYNFRGCKISATAYRVSSNKIKNFVYKFKPLRKMSIIIEDIPKGETREYKLFIEPFMYKNDYNVSVEAECK